MVPVLSQDLREFLDVETHLRESIAPAEPPFDFEDLIREDVRLAIGFIQRATHWARLVVENPKRIPVRGKPAQRVIQVYQDLFIFLVDHVGRRTRFLRGSAPDRINEPPFNDLLEYDEVLRAVLIPISTASTREALLDVLEDFVDQITVADVYNDPTHTFRPLSEVIAEA